MGCDLIGSLTRTKETTFDFGGAAVSNGEFNVLNLTERNLSNLRLEQCYLGELVLPAKGVQSVEFDRCASPRVIGISSPAGVPHWIRGLEAEGFDSVANVSRIRKIGLKPVHEVLTTIIRKTFFQRGSGRKEEALLRGLGSPATRNLTRKVLNLLVREGLLTSFRGDQGDVYAPVRSETKRMQAILDELQGSKDPVWVKAGEL